MNYGLATLALSINIKRPRAISRSSWPPYAFHSILSLLAIFLTSIKGYFSLTQANFKSSNRRSYGQDYYDERMKASRRCNIFGKDEGRHSTEFVVLHTGESAQPARFEDKKAATEPNQQPSPPSTPVADSLDDSPAEQQEDPKTQDEKQGPHWGPTVASRDPLKWFGILVPRELRSAQTSFCSAVDGPIAAAANAARGMREIEAEIRKVRKAVKKAEKAGVE